MSRIHYLEDVDEVAFQKWLRAAGWTEDTSPHTENWVVAAWWHPGRMVVRREDYLVDDYNDFLFEQASKKVTT